MGNLVFISHASKDRAKAEAVLAELEAEGLGCWISSRDIAPGANYQESIVAAISAARAMVLVFTLHANDSTEIKKELSLASVARIAVFPVRIEDVAPTGAFQYELATRQFIDLFVGREAAIHKLAGSIRAIAVAADGDKPEKPQRPTRRGRKAALLGAGGIAAIATVAAIFLHGVPAHSPKDPAAPAAAGPARPAPGADRVFVADQLMANGQYESAIKQYRLAIDADPQDPAVRRRLISALCDHLSVEAFSGDSIIDNGLRDDYEDFQPVDDDQINAALADVFALQAMDPAAKSDPTVLLQQALILKTGGTRVRQAVPVLQQAMALAPQDPHILAELGLLEAVLPQHDQAVRDQGIGLLRRAVALKPSAARYHFYLGRALGDGYDCPYAGLDYKGGGDAQACAEAIREYRAAADRATANDGALARHAQRSAMDIFHRYARKEHDILTPDLAMPAQERLQQIDYLIAADASTSDDDSDDGPKFEDFIAGTSTSQDGPDDDPKFWQAVLLNATGEPAAADHALRAIMATDAAHFASGPPQEFWKNAPYARARPSYFQLFARILQAEQTEPQVLHEVQRTMKQAKIPPG